MDFAFLHLTKMKKTNKIINMEIKYVNTNLKMKIFLNLTICFLAFILAFIVSFLAYSIVYYTLRFLFFIVLVISSITLTLLVLYTVLDIITYRHTYYIIDDEKIVMNS